MEKVQTLRNYRTENLKDYNIMVEYKLLKELAPPGVYLMPEFDNLRVYYGVIFLEMGLYRNGIFKFKLTLPPAYPADGARPNLTFYSKVFHPLVNPGTLELDLAGKFPMWRSGTHHIASVLKFLKQIFYLKDYAVTRAANREAAEMFTNNRNKFLARVETCVAASVERRHHNDPNSSIIFTEYNVQHDVIRDRILRAGAKRQGPVPSSDSGPQVSISDARVEQEARTRPPVPPGAELAGDASAVAPGAEPRDLDEATLAMAALTTAEAAVGDAMGADAEL